MSISLQEVKERASQVNPGIAARQALEWLASSTHVYIDNHRQEFSVNFSAKDIPDMEELAKIEDIFCAIGLDKIEMPEMSAEDFYSQSDLSSEKIDEIYNLINRVSNGEEVSEEEMEEAKRLVLNDSAGIDNLDDESKAIIEEEASKLTAVYDLVKEVERIIREDKAGLQILFDKMVYYYELIGIRHDPEGENDPKRIEKKLEGFVSIENFLYEPYSIPIKITSRKPRVDEDGDYELNEDGDIVVDIIGCETQMVPPNFAVDIRIKYWDKKIQTSLF